jgi:uncharacterized Zn ribbon protein
LDEEIILVYVGGVKVVTWTLKSGGKVREIQLIKKALETVHAKEEINCFC